MIDANAPFLRLREYLGLVRFSHTVFAMPFALLAMMVAADGWPDRRTFGFILLCLVTARTAAMSFNRIADRYIDALNPRTRDRHLPRGSVSVTEAWGIFSIAVLLFLFAAYSLNQLAFLLSPFVLIVICGYSYTKRFTSTSHLILGLSLAMAPAGAWIAILGRLDLPAVLLAAGVLCWVAGFDIIYALLDEEFDRKTGLHSMVIRLGRTGALRASRVLHICSSLFFVGFGYAAGLGLLFWIGWGIFTAALVYEQRLVQPDDISRVDMAFFSVNGPISILLFLFGAADVVWL